MKAFFRLRITIIFLLLSSKILSQSICLNDLEVRNSIFYYKGVIYSGTYECYDEKGKIREHGFIKNGERDSISNIYNTKGELVAQTYYKNNIFQKQVQYRNAIFSNIMITYKLDSAGNTYEDGLWESYYLNGQIKERRYYNKGEPTGEWTAWDNKGNIGIVTTINGDTVIEKRFQIKNKKRFAIIKYYNYKTLKVLKTEKKEE